MRCLLVSVVLCVLAIEAGCVKPNTKYFEEASVPNLTESPNGPPGMVHMKTGAWTDIDNDGDMDFLVTGKVDAYDTIRVYWLENDGQGNFYRRELPIDGVGNEPEPRRQQVLAADFDNDGHQDLYLSPCDYTNIYMDLRTKKKDPLSQFPLDCSTPLILKNNGNATFTVVKDTGIDNPFLASYAGIVGDVNNDGLLDLFIGETLVAAANVHFKDDYKNKLYINKGDFKFEEAGLDLHNPSTCVAVFADLDNDGDQDLITASCMVIKPEDNEMGFDIVKGPLKMMKNTLKEDGEFGFVDVTEEWLGRKIDEAVMGICFADLNDDGVLDFYLGNIGKFLETLYPHSLYISQKNGTWVDEIVERGMPQYDDFVWGCAFVDADMDGHMDLLSVGTFMGLLNPGVIFINKGNGKFKDGGDLGLLKKEASGVAFADFNGDHTFDLAVTGRDNMSLGDEVFLYKGMGGKKKNSFVEIKLQGSQSNRDAIGATVQLCTQQSGKEKCDMRLVAGVDGFSATNSRVLLFGINSKANKKAKAIIRWPSGLVEKKAVYKGKSYLFVEPDQKGKGRAG